MSRPSLRAIVAASSCLALGLGAAWAPIAIADGESSFKRLSTTAAYLNSADSSQESVAESSRVSPDGNTLFYTDAGGGVIGKLDITDPSNPKPLGQLGVGGEPTSVYAIDGYVLVVVDLAGLEGLVEPTDPEPEYVKFSPDGSKIAVTLQENNAVVIVDAKSLEVISSWSAGEATVNDVDTEKDGEINLTGSVTAPREPDSIGWIDNDHVATANEGDWQGGTRGWTIFDAGSGAVVWDAATPSNTRACPSMLPATSTPSPTMTDSTTSTVRRCS